jgi:hypothetical protein
VPYAEYEDATVTPLDGSVVEVVVVVDVVVVVVVGAVGAVVVVVVVEVDVDVGLDPDAPEQAPATEALVGVAEGGAATNTEPLTRVMA